MFFEAVGGKDKFKEKFRIKVLIMKRLIPILFLLLISMVACNSKTDKINQSDSKGTTVTPKAQPVVEKTKPVITLYLQPYNGFPRDKVQKLQSDVQHCLDTLIPERKFEVKLKDNIDLPENCYYKPRSRWRADSILDFQNRIDGKNYTIGVLTQDISSTEHGYQDWGVQGLGSMPGKNAVVSTFRVKNKSLFYKVIVHEFLHNLGLDHCPYNAPSCYICDGYVHPELEPQTRLCEYCKKELLRKIDGE